jgi:GTPase SAR1 family protein
MAQFNEESRELAVKVVYYGPALSGKTTNLQALYQKMDP